MTEKELLDVIKTEVDYLYGGGQNIRSVKYALIRAAKAYADAIVATKDSEISYWKDRWEANNAELNRMSEVAQNAMNYLEGPHQCNPEPTVVYDILSGIFPTETITEFEFRNRPQDTTILPVTNAKNFPRVDFKELAIGDEFYCYGDILMNYDHPKLCRCIKVSETSGIELGGISFFVSETDKVFIELP